MSIQYSSPLPYLGMLASARPVCPTWSQFDKHSRRWKSSRSSNALDFQAAFRDIIPLKRVITIITLMNKKIFHSLFLACASFASASLSVPWNRAACNANKHSKPSGMFYLRFISSYFFSYYYYYFLLYFYRRSALASLLFVHACARSHIHVHKEPPPPRAAWLPSGAEASPAESDYLPFEGLFSARAPKVFSCAGPIKQKKIPSSPR